MNLPIRSWFVGLLSWVAQPCHFEDAVITHIWLVVDERFKFRPTYDLFFKVITDAARRKPFHPVRDYLDSLSWDGVERLDTWLIAYASARDTDYVRAVSALPLIAAVRRVQRPGTKFDELLIIEGDQGTAKSSAVEDMCVNPDWFTDALPLGANSKVTIEQTSGKWIVEASELGGLRKADIDKLKAQLSRTMDVARLAYGRQPTTRPRHFILIGTTNKSASYLLDLTGNRRFWPVKIKRFDLKKLRAARDQLWAEAMVRERRGDSIRLDPSLWQQAAAEQEQRLTEDPWQSRLETLGLGQGRNALNGKVAAADLSHAVNLPLERQTTSEAMRLSDIMHKLGWRRPSKSGRLRRKGEPMKCYVRGSLPDASWLIFHETHFEQEMMMIKSTITVSTPCVGGDRRAPRNTLCVPTVPTVPTSLYRGHYGIYTIYKSARMVGTSAQTAETREFWSST